MKTRHQRGHLYQRSKVWYVRYYKTNQDGKRVQKSHAQALATGEHKTKGSARLLADEFLAPLNVTVDQPSAVTLREFVEQTYLPFVDRALRASTRSGYQNLWKTY